MKQTEFKSKKAIIIGGSMSGLLAARVLSDFYNEVTILERDSLLSDGRHRRGVPQSRHAHGLLAGGREVLDELFPGISEDLIGAGAISADVVNDGKWFFEGDCLRRAPSGTNGILLSRPLLESTIRGRVRALERISVRDSCSVRDLIMVKGLVKGIRTETGVLEADLVVDASGRGSQSAKWLKSLGFPPPREEEVEVRLTYTTRIFRRRKSDMGGDAFASIPVTLENKRSGVILAQEGDRWVVTLIGRFGIEAPEDLEGYRDYAKQLAASYIYDVIRDAEPIGDATVMRFPASIRRRYEELQRFPDGFLVFVDAICSFNPIYGQGMSAAALQAKTLQKELADGRANLAQRFFTRASKVIDTPWNIAVGSDLRMPETVGKRTLAGRIMSWYISKLQRFAHRDADAAVAFLRVAQLLDDPSTLMRPKLVLQVLTGSFQEEPA